MIYVQCKHFSVLAIFLPVEALADYITTYTQDFKLDISLGFDGAICSEYCH